MTDWDTVTICPECSTVAKKNTEEEAEEVAENHNANLHDGEDVAGAGEEFLDHLHDEGKLDGEAYNRLVKVAMTEQEIKEAKERVREDEREKIMAATQLVAEARAGR